MEYRALTIIQPWADAITFGEKRIENRTWATKYRGPLAIHAGMKFDATVEAWLKRKRLVIPPHKWAGQQGAIIAVCDLVDCVEKARSPWFGGPFGFVLENVRPIKPRPMRGALNLWKVDLPRFR